MKATEFRNKLFSTLDRVIQNGQSVQIERNGKILEISLKDSPSKLSRLKERKVVVGDESAIVKTNWYSTWNDALK